MKKCLACNGTRWRKYRSDESLRVHPCPECVPDSEHQAWQRLWPDGNPHPREVRERLGVQC